MSKSCRHQQKKCSNRGERTNRKILRPGMPDILRNIKGASVAETE